MLECEHMKLLFSVLGAITIVLLLAGLIIMMLGEVMEQTARTIETQETRVSAGNAAVLLTAAQEHSTSTVGTTRVKLLEANSGRQYARVELDPSNATTTLYLYEVGTNASTTVIAQGGIPLSATTTSVFEITERNLYTGELWAITEAGSPTVYVTTN